MCAVMCRIPDTETKARERRGSGKGDPEEGDPGEGYPGEGTGQEDNTAQRDRPMNTSKYVKIIKVRASDPNHTVLDLVIVNK